MALAIAEGTHPKAIQSRMGHSSINVTIDRYGLLFPELDEAIATSFGTRLEEAVQRRGQEEVVYTSFDTSMRGPRGTTAAALREARHWRAMAPWTMSDIPDLEGKSFLITGANSGLGLSSASALAAAGASVLMACRSEEKATVAAEKVAAVATGPKPKIVLLDLGDLSSVRSCGREVDSTLERLDVLVNNAGVMALPLTRTGDGFESQFGINHLGHFALSGLLLPTLLRAAQPRVVTVSSQAHRSGRVRWDDPNWHSGRYRKWQAYGQSKLANLLFTLELDRRANQHGSSLLAVAAHPGYARTHLQLQGAEMEGSRLKGSAFSVLNRVGGQSPERGALPQLYAATMAGVQGNDYFGPDGWFEQRGFPTRVERTPAASDAHAARRLWDLSEELTGVTWEW